MYARTVTPSSRPAKVLAYCRVSSEEQARSGAGIEAQRAAIEQEARRRSWADVEWFTDDGYGAGDLERPGITEALDSLARGEAQALVAAKLDRLSRSVADFAPLLKRADRERWGLILLDLDLDTTRPSGRLMAHMMSAIAEFERQRIAERTKEALAAVKARGVRLGRPPAVPEPVRKRIARERKRDRSYASIADRLNRDQVPTAHGGARWWPSTVRAVLQSAGK